MLALLLLAADVDAAERLDLVCVGSGSANKQSSSSVYVHNNYGDSAWGNVVGNRSVPFDDQVNLWIKADKGRLRMPKVMLPLIRGGKDGWYKIKNVRVGRWEITGSIAVNIINNPKFRIDRRNGYITMSGKSGYYSGRCSKYDPNSQALKF